MLLLGNVKGLFFKGTSKKIVNYKSPFLKQQMQILIPDLLQQDDKKGINSCMRNMNSDFEL